jgi:hypothetical protein
MQDQTGLSFVDVATITIEGTVVHRLEPRHHDVDLTAYAWWWPEPRIGGALLTQRPDISGPFLERFFALQPQ